MKYLEIKNLEFKTKLRFYDKINLTINNGQVWGVFSTNKEAVREFLNIISGINSYKNCVTYNELSVFDNHDYFQNRVFFDFENKYITTLKTDIIKKVLDEVYHLEFNEEEFTKCVKDLNIRSEYEIKYQYLFTNLGNTCANFSLLSSLDKKNIIVNNPTLYLRGHKEIEYIINKITDKYRYNTVILGLDNLSVFMGKLDFILMFSDFLGPVIINPITDEFYVFEMIVKPEIQKYKLFDSRDKTRIIVYKSFTDDELKFFKKNKIQFIKIKAYEIENYL